MCGLAGLLSSSPLTSLDQLKAMTRALRHRGPDAEGFWDDNQNGVQLGHRRLAVLDLSESGAQPMKSSTGRYVIIFNGEIYNHPALHRELEKSGKTRCWRGHSDTETLLAAIETWGIANALKKAYGMFSIALWDREQQFLTLARDRMGEKPLYLGCFDGIWAFASELKALLRAPNCRPELDHDAIAAYLAYGYVPENHCIFRGVTKVPAGSLVQIGAKTRLPESLRYFSLRDLTAGSVAQRRADSAFDFDRLSKDMEELLSSVIEEQMLSDVPLGCFLSGGVDSSLVASLMQSRRTTAVRTFSIGFRESRFNEAPHAARVARHLGTEHTEFILSEDDALGVVPDLAEIYDEPFADSSQIPTTLLCREARKAVTVALTGDGGDEIFGGYNRHVLVPDLWRKAGYVPSLIRVPLGRAIGALESAAVRENSALRKLASKAGFPVTAVDKLARIGRGLGEAKTIEDFYEHLVRTFPSPDNILSRCMNDAIRTIGHEDFKTPPLHPTEWMMAIDTLTYLPGDILVKIDRAAMSSSLETRSPFLDARVVDAAWKLPIDAKIKHKTGKHILRDILFRHAPADLIERPKQGFAIPIDHWLRGALREWSATLLARRDLLEMVHLNPEDVSVLWNQHLRGLANHGQKLWTLLMLLAWLAHHANHLRQTTESLMAQTK